MKIAEAIKQAKEKKCKIYSNNVGKGNVMKEQTAKSLTFWLLEDETTDAQKIELLREILNADWHLHEKV